VVDAQSTEVDKEFWNGQPDVLPRAKWAQRQRDLARDDRRIMDGDVGPYDDLHPRLRRADTFIVLDVPLWLCAWRATKSEDWSVATFGRGRIFAMEQPPATARRGRYSGPHA
jgi:hypothetical protein